MSGGTAAYGDRSRLIVILYESITKHAQNISHTGIVIVHDHMGI